MNKYAEGYFNQLADSVKGYRPFDPTSAVDVGAPVAAGIGGGIGALKGLVTDPGYDEYGHKKSRIKEMLKGLVVGGGLGAGAALAAPAVGQAALDLKGKLRSNEIANGTPGGGLGETLMKPINHLDNYIGTQSQKAFLPNVDLEDLMDKAKSSVGMGQ